MTTDFSTRKLTRKPRRYDSRDFRLSEFITPAMRARAAQITQMDWKVDHILDQGDTGHCVGFAWAGFGISVPVADDWKNDMGDTIYYEAKVIDGEPGQEDGSDTLSGVKAFMHFAKLQNSAYAWASSIDDIVTWVLTTGPVITGTNWYNNMFNPNASGLVKVGGGIAGGHEWMISGVDTVKKQFHCTNSWGDSFGVGGQFYISFKDYARLLAEQGDAVTAAEIATAPAPTPTPVPVPAPVPSNEIVVILQKIIDFIESIIQSLTA